MITYPTLFKRTSTGAIQIWFAEQDGDKYRTTSGQLDGKKTTADWTVAKPKNTGKANATTGAEQAEAQVNSLYKKQKKKDYRDSADEVDTVTRFKPMLASKWADRVKKIKQTHVHMQPKLDGIRCIARADGLWTRSGEPIFGVPHVFEKLRPLFEQNPELILDGELYNHKFKDNFNAIASIIKKQTPTDEELVVSAENIEYWVYDMPSATGDFGDRYAQLPAVGLPIVFVDTILVAIELVDKHAAEWIELGYEGAMVRLPGDYQNKRSNFLIKWKEFQDEEFEIVDIVDGDGNRTGVAASVILRLNDPSSIASSIDRGGDGTFSAGVIGDIDYCRELLVKKDEFIGKPGTVVFQNYTPYGVPRFPKFKTVRFEKL